MPFDVTDFNTLMNLESHGPDVFVGIGPSYPWGRVYGGQVVAQALRAACATVDTEYLDRIRNGRSFLTRRVVARQSVGPILNLSASFQVREDQVDVQELKMPTDVPSPDELPPDDWGPILERRMVPDEIATGARSAYWLRVRPDIGDDPMLQACALAYASDDIPTEAASLSHPRRPSPSQDPGGYDRLFVGASLDHAIWFHRPGRHDEWVLHDFRGQGLVGARGLGIGQLFGRDGTHLATVAQEILLRERTR